MDSMTGFGTAAREGSVGRVVVELKSVNHRFLELAFRLPASLGPLESELRALLQDGLSRGRVDVTVRWEPAPDTASPVRLNIPLVASLVEQLRHAVPGSQTQPALLLTVPGVILRDAEAELPPAVRDLALAAAEEALRLLKEQRAREGAALRDAILVQHRALVTHARAVYEKRGEVVLRYRERLKERIADLLGPTGVSLDPGRLEQEVALFADRADITEECTRLAAHLEALAEGARSRGQAVGRQLEFLSQEILREVNTLGSKARDLALARHVLELKQAVEALKEQLANVE